MSPDPYGLIQSKAMISPDRSVRLSLNVSESRETALGRSVSSYSGAGVHHIAFTTDDMVRTAEALKRLGAPLLPVPANYYDDLSARSALDDALLADLQRLGLLYDRDEQGEFLHAYTDAFEGRFFFEAVQRRGYQRTSASSMRPCAWPVRRNAGSTQRSSAADGRRPAAEAE